MTITIVTPWFEHPELVDGYLAAIMPGNADDIVIVDNGSNPPLEFAQIRLDANTGFCHACNVGLAQVDTDAVLFLNNDIRPLRDTWLDEIRAVLQPGRLVGQMRSDDHAAVHGRPVPYIDGWCLAGMADEIRLIGGWDETLLEPAYYSDNMLCLAARRQSYELYHVDVGLTHLENQTSMSTVGNVVRSQQAIISNRRVYDEAAHAELWSVVI